MNPTNPRLAVATLVLAALAAPPLAAGPPVDTSFLKRYAETRGFMLGRPTKPKFTPDGKAVLFLRAAGPTTPKLTLFEFDVATGKTKELLTPEMLLKGGAEDVSPEEKARRERQRVSTGGFADYHLDDTGTRVLVVLSGRPWVFDRASGKVRELNAGKGTIVDPKWSPDGKFVSYVRDHDVMAYDLASDKELSVTTGGTAVKTHGLAEFVAQEEMDRHTGYWWSPDSKFIAYEEADHAGVEVWHIADPFKPGVAPQPQYYPRPGKKNVSVRLGVVPVTGGPTVWVEMPKAYEYLTGAEFLDDDTLLLILQNRQHNEISASVYSLTNRQWNGGLGTKPQSGWVDVPPGPRRSSTGGVLLQMPTTVDDPDAPRALYHATSEPLFLTLGDIDGLVAADPQSGTVLATRRPDPTQVEAIRVTAADRKKDFLKPARTSLSNGPGVHAAVVATDLATGAFTSTALDRMPTSVVRSTGPDAKSFGTLQSIAEEPPFKPNVAVQKVGDYWTAVVRPRDFDPKKKYPVVVDVYGGPHHLHVQQAMRNWLVPQWLADQGFVVVAIDGRGTPGRGRDWERAIYQKLGTVPLDDQVKGLHALCDKFPELDRDRVGIVGWSFGGYMAANGVLRRPDVFRAAVAGAPVTDWEDYDTHYTERYLGLLPESRKAYDEASLLPLAKNLSRPLLLVHGTADDNVYYRHSLKLADALFRAGREFEMLPLPGVTHMVSADPQVAERLWERTVLFFKRHLGEAK